MSYNYTYFTVLSNNHDSKHVDGMPEPHLQFREDREAPIITNCSDYDVAITNFKLDTKCLPSFIPTIKFNNDSPTDIQRNETIYQITLGIRTEEGANLGIRAPGDVPFLSHTEPVMFVPQDTTTNNESDIAPPFQSGYANYKSGYYDLFNFENFFTMVNKAISDCMEGLKTFWDSFYGPGMFLNKHGNSNGDIDIPYFIFDKGTGLIFLNSPQTVEGLTIFLNFPLYRLFDSLPFQRKYTKFINSDGRTGRTSSYNLYKLVLTNFGNSNAVDLIPQTTGQNSATVKVPHYVIYQDYETLTSWSPVESIVISSGNLPIKSSVVSQNHSFINGIETVEGSSNIVEMEMSEFRAGQPKPGIIYEPTILRWVNMLDQNELRSIHLQVFYRLKMNGQLIPFKLNSGGSFGMKLCFRKLKN